MEVSAANSLRSERVSGCSKSERSEHSERSELVERSETVQDRDWDDRDCSRQRDWDDRDCSRQRLRRPRLFKTETETTETVPDRDWETEETNRPLLLIVRCFVCLFVCLYNERSLGGPGGYREFPPQREPLCTAHKKYRLITGPGAHKGGTRRSFI